MSWNANFVGRPERIAEALEAKARDLSGQNKVEFEAALPHMTGLLALNYATPPRTAPLIRLDASGSASTHDGAIVSSSCTIKIEAIHGDPLL